MKKPSSKLFCLLHVFPVVHKWYVNLLDKGCDRDSYNVVLLFYKEKFAILVGYYTISLFALQINLNSSGQ